MKIENENTFHRSLWQGINLFVGSGFALLTKDLNGEPLPNGSELATELVTQFSLSTASELNLSQICTIIESSRRSDLRAYLKKRFTISDYDSRYEVLDRFSVKSIFTTNIDDLLYKVYANSQHSYLNDLDAKGPAYKDRRAIDVITLHGCVLDDKRPFRFSTSDLASAFGADPDRWHFLTQRLQQFPTLFWGYSLNDAGALQALSPEAIKGREHKDKWIVLRPSTAETGAVDFFRALNFQIIVADTSEMLDYLGNLQVPAGEAVPVPHRSTLSLFPQESIPAIGTVPVRPILEFYLGAPPHWSDIFTGRLHKTAHFGRIQNSINSGKNTVVVGVPACGKTTLLMQVATEMSSIGHTLLCDSMSIEKARLIVKLLKGEKALIFIDNFADSLDGFNCLGSYSNIQIIGADRHYNFAVVSHRIDPSQYNIIDVTELSMSDIQSCLQSIPEAISNKSFNWPQTNMREHNSLFEIIEANVIGPTLRQRFRSVLSELRKQDVNLRDLLLMVSYVHQCRIPASMDMLIAFLREATTDYKEVYRMRDALGKMLSEYVGDLVETTQDHFVARSTIVGEAILAGANDSELKEMLLRFHNNVSPYRICRYDVFRRHAYDADLAVRAFPRWQEGKKFYESLYWRDGSPFMLQQCALYLSRKGQHIEAFEMIDRAITETGGQVWSIRNSHAIILFKANIHHHNDPTAQRTLMQSMAILTECYKWDNRRPFHAEVFAEQALSYWDIYRDEQAHQYLVTARDWLVDEQKRSPWNRRVRQLLPEIKTVLGE